jgi:sugar lactone lactonase YvrE
MLLPVSAIRRAARAAAVSAACAAAAANASAQQIITTVVGRPEVIAVAVDRSSSGIYVATDRPGAIYRVSAGAGPVLIAGVAGGSTADGAPASQAAVFPGRNGLAVDALGNVYFSEPSLHRVRQISKSTATVTTIAGTGGDGGQSDPRQITGNFAQFTKLAAPGALAFNPQTGDLFIADEAWDIVYRIVAAGSPIAGSSALVRAVGGNPSNASIFVNFQFYNPFGYAGDSGQAIDAKLNHPRGLAFDAAGSLYIADTGNSVVRRVDASSVITTVVSTLFMPTGVVVDGGGNLLIADAASHRVRMVAAGTSTITTIAGSGAAGHAGDGGPATAASLAYPTGVDLDPNGQLLIVDSQNNRVRTVAAEGTIQTLVQGGTDYSGDGLPGGDAVNQPLSAVIDRAGNLFFSDSGNARVRRLDAATGAVTTIAGSGVPGWSGDGAAAVAARLNCPAGLAFGVSGELFVADPCAQVVRRVDPGADGFVTGAADEIITTYAGNGIGDGFAGPDGSPAASSSLLGPFSLGASSSGTLYIGEPIKEDVRTVDASGVLGTYTSGQNSRGLAVDSQDHVILADDGEDDAIECDGLSIASTGQFVAGVGWSALSVDSLVRLFVSTDGASQAVFQVTRPGGAPLCGGFGQTDVTSIAGIGAVGYSGDGGASTAATLHHPAGTALDTHGTLFIADSGNNVIRKLFQPVAGVITDVSRVDFGTTGLLTATPTKLVTVTSIGTSSATFGGSTLAGGNAGDFAIVSDGCAGATLATGQHCQVGVSFKPTDLGARSATLQINDNAPGSPQLVALGGVGATLDVAPSTLAFGSQAQGGASAPIQVTVTNRASTSVTGLSLSFTGAAAGDFGVSADGCTGAALATQASCSFSVTFTPQATGLRGATLDVLSSAADSPRALDASGTGVAVVAGVQISQTSVVFPTTTVGSASAAVTLTVTSAGTAPLSMGALSLAGNQTGDFSVTGNTCSGATLAPTQTCAVQVAFAPKQVCASTATLSFTDNAPDTPQSVPLSGTGTNGSAAAFHSVLFCTTHAAQPQELAAGPDGNVWFDETGSAFAGPTIARANATAGVFIEDAFALMPEYKPFELTFAPDGSHAFVEARGGGFQSFLAIVNPAGRKIESPVTFEGALTAGPDGGFWLAQLFTCGGNDFPLVTDFAPGGKTRSYTPTLQWLPANTNNHVCLHTSSITTGPDGNVWVGTTTGGVGITLPSVNGFVRLARDGVFIDFTPTDTSPLASVIGVDGNLYALMGVPSSTCTLERFDASVNATPIALAPSVFSLACQGIAAGPDGRIWLTGSQFTGSAIVAALIAFDPSSGGVSVYPTPAIPLTGTNVAAGPDEGIWFSAVPSAVGRFDIGGGPARAFVNPRLLGFAPTPIGLPSAIQSVVVQSTGTAPLTVTGVSIAGADASQFVIGTNGCIGAALPPGSSCVVTVASKPTANGSHTATLVIQDNDAFSPQIVRLKEFALPPQPIASPPSLAFPTTKVGQQSAPSVVTLTNPRDASLHVQFVSKGGANAGDFAIQSDGCTGADVPANGGQCAVSIRFVPTAAGSRTATLTFTDAANPPTQTVTLTGGGQASSGTGTSCGCSTTGLFVDPSSVEPLPTSPSFTLTVTPNGPNGGPAMFTITKAGSGTLVAQIQPPNDATWPPLTPPAWGFSPDGNRFALHYQSAQDDVIELFDLTGATPGTPVWMNSASIASGGSTVPSGAMAFSPRGGYLVAAQIHIETAPPATQTATLFVVSSSGVKVGGGPIDSWIIATPPAVPDEDKFVESAHWGFGPDDQSFVYVRDALNTPQTLRLISLPTGTVVQELPFTSSVSSFAQFSPCGEALAVAGNSATDETIELYSTKAADARAPALGTAHSLTIGATTLTAGPTEYVAQIQGASPDTFNIAPNTSTASCASSTTSGSGGGATTTTIVTPHFTADQPPLSVFEGEPYTYAFAADGPPAPQFALDPSAPSWLSIDEDTGELTGQPDPGTTTFSYRVIASNGAIQTATAGPFDVTVNPAPPPPPGTRPGSAAPARAAAASTTAPLPPPGVLLLPNARGTIGLPADVTPAVSIFTYTETDAPTAPLGALTFAGLDFTVAAVDNVSGLPVPAIVDALRATIVFGDAEMRSARITDLSRLGLYWWSGSAWVNQLPCAGCTVDSNARTLTAALTQLGEYVLAAVPPPPPVLTVTPAPIHATAGAPFAGAIATFPPANPLDQLNQFAALVNWGDGQVSPAGISLSSGTFIVSGSHTWSASGGYPVGITIFDNGAVFGAQTAASVAPAPVAPQFTAATPPLTATQGVAYSYTFTASGAPAPTFALAAGAPSWLTIGAASGVVAGTPPIGATSFTYSVVASNGGAPDAVAGPFIVGVASSGGNTADLSIAIAGPPTAPKASLTYTVVVTNNGPSAAIDGTVLLLAGPHAFLVGAAPEPSINGIGFWAWRFARLDAGQTLTFTVNLRATFTDVVFALGLVGSDTHDPNAANNAALAATWVR